MNLEDFRNIPFKMQDLSSVFPDCVNLPMKAKRLENSGAIIRLKRGMYVVSPEISRVRLSTFLIANHICGPSYVSEQSALRYYGLIPEGVYTVKSMTAGVARNYNNAIGTFAYTHIPKQYFNIGVTVGNDGEASFLVATPEKALCDLMVYTPNLNLRFLKEIGEYLKYNLRFDMDELAKFDTEIMRECMEYSRKKTMLNKLIKFIEYGRNL